MAQSSGIKIRASEEFTNSDLLRHNTARTVPRRRHRRCASQPITTGHVLHKRLRRTDPLNRRPDHDEGGVFNSLGHVRKETFSHLGTGIFSLPRTRMPSHVKTYDGSGDPEDHLKLFQSAAKTEGWAMPTLEEKINVAIHPEYPEQTVAIRSTLTEKGRKELCSLLKQNLYIFAWKPADMMGVPRSIVEHPFCKYPRGMFTHSPAERKEGKAPEQK
ncbi:hypothetical protein Tco_0566724 [Tanacetum coccineum]